MRQSPRAALTGIHNDNQSALRMWHGGNTMWSSTLCGCQQSMIIDTVAMDTVWVWILCNRRNCVITKHCDHGRCMVMVTVKVLNTILPLKMCDRKYYDHRKCVNSVWSCWCVIVDNTWSWALFVDKKWTLCEREKCATANTVSSPKVCHYL